MRKDKVRVGVSPQTIHAIETGKYDPNLPLAFVLAQIFKLRIEEMFEGKGRERAEAGCQRSEAITAMVYMVSGRSLS